MVRIRLMGAFTHLAKAREIEIKLESPKTADELLEEVIPRYNEFHDKIILINGKPAKGSALVEEGDEVKVMPVLSGG